MSRILAPGLTGRFPVRIWPTEKVLAVGVILVYESVMGTGQATMDFFLDQLSALPGVRARKMFGEYAVYFEEKVVALVCNDQLFVKITPAGKALVGERYEEGQAYPGAKPSMLIGAEEIDDRERLCELIRVTASALPAPKPKKKKKKVKLPAASSGAS